jgi:hypothetical protein
MEMETRTVLEGEAMNGLPLASILAAAVYAAGGSIEIPLGLEDMEFDLKMHVDLAADTLILTVVEAE